MILDRITTQKNTFEEDKTSEKPVRSIAKAISWRVVGTLDTLIVSYWITGTWGTAAAISSVDFVTKMILYFFHERVWNKIKWGK